MLITAAQLSQQDFARAYWWDVNFPSYGGSFFPAQSMEDIVVAFKTASLDIGGESFSYPTSAGRGDVSFVLPEVEDWGLLKWVEAWARLIYDRNSFGVGLLGDQKIARQVFLSEQLGDKSAARDVTELLVVPSSDFSIPKASGKATGISYNLSFIVVGY